MANNRKKLMLPAAMAEAGWNVARARDDLELLRFEDATPADAFRAMLSQADGIALWGRPFPASDVELAPELKVVARIGVGYDAVDVSALTRRGIPLLIAGTANSVTVAEHAVYFMMELAKQGAALHSMVRNGSWTEKFSVKIYDLYGKTVLVVGFGKIGTRVAARCLAMEMTVLVHDPFVPEDAIRARGAIPAPDLDAALPKADFVTIHCPKSPDTVGLFDAGRLARMKRSAFLVNTARGGIIDEAALYQALTTGGIAGAGLDVFSQEPIEPGNRLPALPNVISAPHMAGVTQESLDRMAVTTVRNILGVFDGRVEAGNVVNKEVLTAPPPAD
jgi:D-3-phosphoglycerate dehydrogenase / 2-oxoglutarate reductase